MEEQIYIFLLRVRCDDHIHVLARIRPAVNSRNDINPSHCVCVCVRARARMCTIIQGNRDTGIEQGMASVLIEYTVD